MPMTKKGSKIMRAMRKTYGSKAKAERVFYASANKGGGSRACTAARSGAGDGGS